MSRMILVMAAMALNIAAQNITALNSTTSNIAGSSNMMALVCGVPGSGTVTTGCLLAFQKSVDDSLFVLFAMLCVVILMLLVR